MSKRFFGKSLVLFSLMVALLAGTLVAFAQPQSAEAKSAQAHAIKCANYDFKRGASAGWYHVHSGGSVCWDGSRIWQSGNGPDCSIYAYPLYSANTTWCGIYNSGGSYVDIGLNAQWSTVWGSTWPCHMRARINNNGSLVHVFANC